MGVIVRELVFRVGTQVSWILPAKLQRVAKDFEILQNLVKY